MPSHTRAHASFASEWWLAETFALIKARLPASRYNFTTKASDKSGASPIQKISLAVALALLKPDVN